jgi:hypothetical protein
MDGSMEPTVTFDSLTACYDDCGSVNAKMVILWQHTSPMTTTPPNRAFIIIIVFTLTTKIAQGGTRWAGSSRSNDVGYFLFDVVKNT